MRGGMRSLVLFHHGLLAPLFRPHSAQQNARPGRGSLLPALRSTQFSYGGFLKVATEEFATSMDAQFLIDMHAVGLHRMLADDQSGGNLLVAVAAQQPFTYLPLGLRQRKSRRHLQREGGVLWCQRDCQRAAFAGHRCLDPKMARGNLDLDCMRQEILRPGRQARWPAVAPSRSALLG